MRVTLCVDALEPQPGGIGRYTWQLCEGLREQPSISRLLFYGRGGLVSDPAVLLKTGEVARANGRAARLIRQWQNGRLLNSSIVHGPNYFLPSSAETGIITVHDLSVLRYPETHPKARVQAFEREFSNSLARAVHVITDTETVRQELISDLSLRPENVSAVWLGVDQRFRPHSAEELAAPLSRLGLTPGGYGLCVSTLEPRKKIGELVTAWRLLPLAVRSRHQLVLAGGKGWLNDHLHQTISGGVEEGWLRHLGFVEEDLLPALYAGAAVFAYPSIYEGFGLPPIEAMASGIPTVVAGRSCLPEVCAAAAEYVDPDDVVNFSRALERLLSDDQRRASAISRGLARSKTFTWQRCTDGTVSVYRTACRSG